MMESPLTVPSQIDPDVPNSCTFLPTHAASPDGSFAVSRRVTTGSAIDTVLGAFFDHASSTVVLSTRWGVGTCTANAKTSGASAPGDITVERNISSRAIWSLPSTRVSTIRFGPSSRYASELHVWTKEMTAPSCELVTTTSFAETVVLRLNIASRSFIPRARSRRAVCEPERLTPSNRRA